MDNNLEKIVVDTLQLQRNEARSFVVAVSGGLDSTSLLRIVHDFQKDYPVSVSALHMNYGLRGEASDLDAIFVKNLCEELKVPLVIKNCIDAPTTGIQLWAREARQRAREEFPVGDEWIEGHHRDDQLETFFLRLFRGASNRGLAGMKECSQRGGRKIWRPFLKVGKRSIENLARQQGWAWREDVTNRETYYDRNWIRQRLIPLIQERFPSALDSVDRFMQILADENRDAEISFSKRLSEWKTDREGNVLRWDPLQNESPSCVRAFLHRWVEHQTGVTLSSEQAHELALKASQEGVFWFNAPKGFRIRGIVSKGRERRLKLLSPISFLAMERDDNSDSGIILNRQA